MVACLKHYKQIKVVCDLSLTSWVKNRIFLLSDLFPCNATSNVGGVKLTFYMQNWFKHTAIVISDTPTSSTLSAE